jgi:uridine kinase
MKTKEKSMGLFIKVTKEEEDIVKQLREKHAVNISQFIRNALINHYKKLEAIHEKE